VTTNMPKQRDALLFVKFWDRGKGRLTFCGALPITQDSLVLERFNQLRTLCGTDKTFKIDVLNISSKTHFRSVNLHSSFRQQGLRTGTILVLQPCGKATFSTEPQTGLANPPYSEHLYRSDSSLNPHSLGLKLYEQAYSVRYTDVVIISESTDNSFKIPAHKSVLATVSYFKTCFESGMLESANSTVTELKAPEWATETGLRYFLLCVYTDSEFLHQLPVKHLCDLLKLFDFYGCEDLLAHVIATLESKYANLTGETALLLLETIEPLEFKRKTSLQKLAVGYMVCNFSEIARMTEFHELFGTDIYHRIVDSVTRATWPNT
jgi:hypothetical protein